VAGGQAEEGWMGRQWESREGSRWLCLTSGLLGFCVQEDKTLPSLSDPQGGSLRIMEQGKHQAGCWMSMGSQSPSPSQAC
jgi:hypothetical protein